MLTGEDPAAIVVVPGSHRSDAIGEAKVVEIPPHSVFLARGDLVHGGAGAEQEVKTMEPGKRKGKFNLRVHMYGTTEGEQDNIFLL